MALQEISLIDDVVLGGQRRPALTAAVATTVPTNAAPSPIVELHGKRQLRCSARAGTR